MSLADLEARAERRQRMAEERAKRLAGGITRAQLPALPAEVRPAAMEPAGTRASRGKPDASKVRVVTPTGQTRTRRAQRPQVEPSTGGRNGTRRQATWLQGVTRGIEHCDGCDATIQPGRRRLSMTDPIHPRVTTIRCLTCGVPPD